MLPRILTIIDGHPVIPGAITYIVYTHLAIHNYQKNISLFITKLGHYLIVLKIL
jgi:hypothetical protein